MAGKKGPFKLTRNEFLAMFPEDQRTWWDKQRKFVEDHQEQSAHCNNCRRLTLHRLLKSTCDERIEEYNREMYAPETGEVPSCVFFDMLECCGCREVVLRRPFHCPDPEVHRQVTGAVVIDEARSKTPCAIFHPLLLETRRSGGPNYQRTCAKFWKRFTGP